MDMMNYAQLSVRFPLCNNCISSSEAWATLLKRWRDDGKLKEVRDWKWGPSPEGNNQPTRLYDVRRVVKIIVSEHQHGSQRPRIGYLCQNYTEQFIDILTPVASVTFDEEQAVTP